jgi:hypothetical protein
MYDKEIVLDLLNNMIGATIFRIYNENKGK